MDARTTPRPGFGTHATVRSIATLLVLLPLGACMGTGWGLDQSFDASTRQLFTTGYRQIATRYIDPVSLDSLAVNGLNGLATVDPAVAVVRVEGLIWLRAADLTVESFAAPPDGDAAGWAEVTAEVLVKSREARPLLKAAGVETLYAAVFDAALLELDGFTRYSNATSAREERARRVGFGGIGIRIQLDDDLPEVLSVIPATPAAAAGILAHDRITHVDGVAVLGMSLAMVVEQLRGPRDTTVEVTLSRVGSDRPIVLTVRREHIVPPTVTARVEDDLLYLQITNFNQDTGQTVSRELAAARRRMGHDLAGVILDLRNNPGGLLDQAVEVSDLFLAEGEITTTRGRHPESFQNFQASVPDMAAGLAMVVLINGNTASASEIVAAALQDQGRAVLVGSNSFGKGTVQTVVRLPNDGELIMTWSRLHAPSGYLINRLGVMPTVCTSGVTEGARSVLDTLRRKFQDTVALMGKWRRHVKPDEAASEPLRAACPAAKGENDIELEVARRLMGDPALYRQALEVASYPELAAGAEPASLTE